MVEVFLGEKQGLSQGLGYQSCGNRCGGIDGLESWSQAWLSTLAQVVEREATCRCSRPVGTMDNVCLCSDECPLKGMGQWIGSGQAVRDFYQVGWKSWWKQM